METIIAKHIVKPSSPTPHRFKTHKLSSLDQAIPPIYGHIIFFYENDESKQQEEISRRLKQSLSEILTIFYPLAGKLKQSSFVDCDDTGAEFVEARVHARLAHFTQNPRMEELKKLLPAYVISFDEDAVQLLVKASFFDCGGVAVAVCLSHKIADAASLVAFSNAWAAACRGEASRIVRPSFELASSFPARDPPPPAGGPPMRGDITTKRFIFDSEKLEKLRKEEAANGHYPSRSEAVCAFVWRTFIEAARAKASVAFVTVNMRPRVVPPLPDQTFGNCIAPAVALASSPEEVGVLTSKLRAALRAVNDVDVAAQEEIYDLVKSGLYFSFTSLLRFPMYEVDFGWGKPVWVCIPTMPPPNLVLLMRTASGDGIEAWVNITDHNFFQMLQTNFNKLRPINVVSRI